MDLMEYQAKELFAKHGVPVLPGETVDTAAAPRDLVTPALRLASSFVTSV